jgi:hypothetical protein
MQIRRQRGEAPFSYFKMFGGLRRMAGRGLEYALKKALIAALGWNLLLLVKSLMRNGVKGPVSGILRPVIALVQLIMGLLGHLQAQPTTKTRASRFALIAQVC